MTIIVPPEYNRFSRYYLKQVERSVGAGFRQEPAEAKKQLSGSVSVRSEPGTIVNVQKLGSADSLFPVACSLIGKFDT